MRRLRPRTALVGLLVLVAVGWLLGARINGFSFGGATAGQSYGSGDVSGKGSVELLVDFGTASGREPLVKHVHDFAGTGWQLFGAAGLDVQGTADYPSSFVCRIEGWPDAAQQDCGSAPGPSQGHWAYFVTSAKLPGHWLISGVGAAGHRPECGQAEAWVWVLPGKQPNEVQPSLAPEVGSCRG